MCVIAAWKVHTKHALFIANLWPPAWYGLHAQVVVLPGLRPVAALRARHRPSQPQPPHAAPQQRALTYVYHMQAHMSIQAHTAQARTYTRHGTHVQRHAGGARAAARSRSLLSKPLIHARHNAVHTLPLIPLQPRSECCTRSRGTALHCFRSQDIRTRAPLHFGLTNLHASSLYESVGAALSCCAHSFSCAHSCASPLYSSLSFLFGTHLWACSRSSACCTLGSHKLADHTTTATVQRHHKHASMRAL